MTYILDAPLGPSAMKRAACHEIRRRLGRFFSRNMVIAFEEWRNATPGTPFNYETFVSAYGRLNEAHTDELIDYYSLLEEEECAIQGPQGEPGIQGEQGIQGIQGEQGEPGEPGPEYLYWQAESMGLVNSTTGFFSRATINQNNPSGLATTQSANLYQNGQLTPWLMPGEWELADLKVLVSAACVSTATVGTAPTFRLDLYQVNTASRTFISTQRLPCIANPTLINPNNSLALASTFIYFAKDTFDPAVQPADSTLFGVEFVNESGSEDTINGYARATLSVVFKRI